jgi:hypothetical protein
MMKPFFMLPGEPFDSCRDHFHFKVSMEVGVPNYQGASMMAVSTLF